MAPASFDEILGQFYIAFGKGVGGLRVSREAVEKLRERYAKMIEDKLIPDWDNIAAQVLERVEAIGRGAASLATQAWDTTIDAYEFEQAAINVEKASRTPICE